MLKYVFIIFSLEGVEADKSKDESVLSIFASSSCSFIRGLALASLNSSKHLIIVWIKYNEYWKI